MKRIALLIGNSDGLEGVKKDLVNWKRFLYSLKGGAWNSSEIITLMNPRKEKLCSTIEDIRGECDFAIVVFSGHGEYQNGFTQLAINEKCDIIQDQYLIGIADKQITVFDCCRDIEDDSSLLLENQQITFSRDGGTLKRNPRSIIRNLYDERIEQACCQQVVLYSCEVGEFSEDTSEGGSYIKNLLKQARAINTEKYGLIGNIHQKTLHPVQSYAASKKHKQTPQASMIKCMPQRQLILSLNPNLLL